MDIYLAAWLATIAATQLPTHRQPPHTNANIMRQNAALYCVFTCPPPRNLSAYQSYVLLSLTPLYERYKNVDVGRLLLLFYYCIRMCFSRFPP